MQKIRIPYTVGMNTSHFAGLIQSILDDGLIFERVDRTDLLNLLHLANHRFLTLQERLLILFTPDLKRYAPSQMEAESYEAIMEAARMAAICQVIATLLMNEPRAEFQLDRQVPVLEGIEPAATRPKGKSAVVAESPKTDKMSMTVYFEDRSGWWIFPKMFAVVDLMLHGHDLDFEIEYSALVDGLDYFLTILRDHPDYLAHPDSPEHGIIKEYAGKLVQVISSLGELSDASSDLD